MNECANALLRLPGTAEEKEWLSERLEMLSIKEGIALAAAVERSPPATMMDAVNHLLTLAEYTVCPAGSYEQLGEFYLREQCVPQEQRFYFDKAALGEWYEDQHPGLFVGQCYVAYPELDEPVPYDGKYLPMDDEWLDWSVRLKLASKQVSEGVWVKFPDYDEFDDEKSSDFHLALDKLKVDVLEDCIVLEARCVLPCIQDLASQYANLADLIYDGQELGMTLDKQRQDKRDFLDRFFAALEYEYCCRLDDAVRIVGDLSSYDIVSKDKFLDNAMQELSKQRWAKDGEGVKNCFDYVAYAGALAEQQGYTLTDDEQFYVRKRDSPVLELQQNDMTM